MTGPLVQLKTSSRFSVAAGYMRDTPGIFQNVRNSKGRHCEACVTAAGRNFETFCSFFAKNIQMISVTLTCCCYCSFSLLLLTIEGISDNVNPNRLCAHYISCKFVAFVVNDLFIFYEYISIY